MGSALRNKRWFRVLTHVCRILFALTFITSGFVKAIDPWGTALNITNYLVIYGLEALKPYVMVFSIWLCGAELMMGCMMLFKVRVRLISIFAVLSMIFFTTLTFLSATWIPVEDCGCFGEVVKLSPWKTFLKNLVLLPMAVCVWWRYRPDRIFAFSTIELALTILFCSTSMGVGIYSYYHLPPLDFLPYRVGVNIAEAMEKARTEQASADVVLVYRNRRTGKLKEFSLKDKAWHNEKRWEWVETRVSEDADNRVEPMILEFFVSDGNGADVTDSLLSVKGKLYMLCVSRADAVGEKCGRRLRSAIERAEAEGAGVVCLTPQILQGETRVSFAGSNPVKCSHIDAKTMKTMLRPDFGLVFLPDGTIIDKRNCRDIR